MRRQSLPNDSYYFMYAGMESGLSLVVASTASIETGQPQRMLESKRKIASGPNVPTATNAEIATQLRGEDQKKTTR
jgi:hypothetical protein